jgi:predicted transcriptional regulator
MLGGVLIARTHIEWNCSQLLICPVCLVHPNFNLYALIRIIITLGNVLLAVFHAVMWLLQLWNCKERSVFPERLITRLSKMRKITTESDSLLSLTEPYPELVIPSSHSHNVPCFLTNFMGQSTSWEANSCSAIQGIPSVLTEDHKRPPLVYIFSHMNRIHIPILFL